ncbi:MAG: AMP-binding protein [Oligoflexia bacterium]|nr:AMP-binding protein [Oligoflexia bacterium]
MTQNTRVATRPWNKSTPSVLLNPRLPEAEKSRIRAALEGIGPQRPGIWVSTSGSTSAPGFSKWVSLSREAVLASARAVNAYLRAGSSDIWIHPLPAFHVGGIGILARAQLSGTLVVEGLGEKGWDPHFFHAQCATHRATLSALVPTQVHDLVSAGLSSPPGLRAIVIGGGALSESLYQRARELGWPLLPSYGLSECASQVATSNPERLGDPTLELLPHVDVRLSADGALEIKSEAMLSGYGLVSDTRAEWLDPKHDGWFTTEDHAELGPERTLKMLGRTADFVKIGGESVNLAQLEKVLESILGELTSTREAALAAVPDERLGHVIYLVSGEKAAPEIFERFNRRVLPFERARKLVRISEPLPRSPLGKILRGRLIDLVKKESP